MLESLTPRPLTLATGLFVLFSCVCLGLCEEAKNDQCPAPCPGITVLAPAGPPGPKGDMGRTGPRGRRRRCETKCAGEDGKGLTLGPLKILSGKGKPFVIGRPGEDGEKGAPGTPGTPGQKGDTGARGAPGKAGPRGEKGSNGWLGLQGMPGRKGAKGDQGQAGANGMQGSPGLGVPGEKGAKGDPGVQGPPGSSGANAVGDSSKAVQGPPGTKGVTGEKGEKGNKGVPGERGYVGEQGRQGYPGSPGPEGTPGLRGAKGAPGKSGDPGKPGYPGDNGQPGIPGQVGLKGDKGDLGESCSSSCGGTVLGSQTRLADLPFVAFSASLSDRILNVLENTILTYDVVHTNVGRAYDMRTGKFAPSVAGYYMFSFSGMTTSVKGSAYWSRLMLNGEPVISLYDKSLGEHLSSRNSVIVLLKPGDEVWVELDQRSSMWGDYTGYVTFSGFLIHHV